MNRPPSNRRDLLRLAASAAFCSWAGPLRAGPEGYADIPTALYAWGRLPGVQDMQDLCDYAVKHGIATLYVQILSEFRSKLLAGDRTAVKSIKVLRDSGLVSHGLCGEPTWCQRPDLSPTVTDLCRIHERYGVFSGLHFDVEPHVLDEWDNESKRPGLMLGLSQFLARAREAMPATLQEQAALHPKFCVIEMSNGQMFLPSIAPSVDEVSLMAYRSTPEGQMDWAAEGYPSVEAAGIAWRMATLTTRPASSISYYGRSTRGFKKDMVKLWELLEAPLHPLRRGLAYEHHGADSLGSILKP